jgi:thiamine-phosphate pyrophosphorylase
MKQHFNHSLYCITCSEYSRGRSVIETAQEMVSGGATIIQYREKDKNKKDKYTECLALRAITSMAGVTFIVNDDLDIALAVKADGLHIGQNDLPIEAARPIAGNNFIIGVSTHSPEQAQNAIQRGADYIGVGPIFPTKTKKDVCDAVGLQYLEYAVKHLSIPFVAIGGIKLSNINEVLYRGAKCIAMVTEITLSDNIANTVKQSISIIEKK